MVQRAPLQRNFFVRENNWHERPFLDLSSDNRFSATHPGQQSIHPRCLPVETALKDCAGLSVKEFALIVLDENGEEKTYTSTSLTPYQRRIFSERFKLDFRRYVHRAAQGSYPQSAYSQDGSAYSDFDTESDIRSKQTTSGESSSEGPRRYQRQSRSEETDDDSANGRFSRKRHRQDTDDTPVPVPVMKTQQLVIGDDAEVDKFYTVRFKDMQQFSCKIMGKAFVKLVEPKKQTHHPYTKGAAKAPPWWPETSGDNHVRHREPDHLLKAERIRLLVHILKMIVEPPMKQCATVQKLGLNVKKLEEVTMEAMSNFFGDKDHPENAQKKVYLKEIFKVARNQERYKAGEIDGTTRVPVQFGDRNAQEYSDEDDLDDAVKDEDEENEAVATSMPSSENMVSPPMLQASNLQSPDESEFFRNRPIPVRYNTQPHGSIDDNHSYETYLPRSMNVGFQQVSTTVQEPLRRSFTPTNFQTQQNLYGWQNSMVTHAGQSQFYVNSPQTSLPPQSIPYQLPPPIAQTMLPPPPLPQHHFSDGLSTGRYDSGPALGNQLRTGSLGHPHHLPHGFPDYMQESNYVHNEADIKHDPGPHMHAS